MEEETLNFIIGLLTGLILMIVLMDMVSSGKILYFLEEDSKMINQETANDLCIKITGNESTIAKDYWDYSQPTIKKGQIVCELPSYDSTQNIIVKTNG